MAKRKSPLVRRGRGRQRARAKGSRRIARGAASYIVWGLVRDKTTHAPLSRMLVKIVGSAAPGNFGKQARTNLLGLYFMPGVLPGRILIEASGRGYPPLEKDRTIAGHTNINFDM